MKKLLVFAGSTLPAVLFSGCTAVSDFKPVAPMVMTSQLTRDNVEILDTVTGKAYSKAYFFYLVQSVNGHIVVLGIGLFEDKYADVPGYLNLGPSTLTRAYYDALTKQPDADFVLPKSFRRSGFTSFGFYEHTEVEVTGKAVKVKTDRELKSK